AGGTTGDSAHSGSSRSQKARRGTASGACMPRASSPDVYKSLRPDLGDRAEAGQPHREVEVGREVPDHLAHAFLARERKRVRVRTADEHGTRPQRQRLEDVCASAHAAVEEDWNSVGDNLDD